MRKDWNGPCVTGILAREDVGGCHGVGPQKFRFACLPDRQAKFLNEDAHAGRSAVIRGFSIRGNLRPHEDGRVNGTAAISAG